MTQQLRISALLCLVLMASAVTAQDAGLFGAPKKSNFEAMLDKLTKVGMATLYCCLAITPFPLPRTLSLL